jgi:hypothetical protein
MQQRFVSLILLNAAYGFFSEVAVCEKVESKGRTTYNEVADELVSEFTNPDSPRILPDQVLYHPASNNERFREKVKLIVWEVDLTAVDLIAGSWL